jgi:hypothetical protein
MGSVHWGFQCADFIGNLKKQTINIVIYQGMNDVFSRKINTETFVTRFIAAKFLLYTSPHMRI